MERNRSEGSHEGARMKTTLSGVARSTWGFRTRVRIRAQDEVSSAYKVAFELWRISAFGVDHLFEMKVEHGPSAKTGCEIRSLTSTV